MRNLLVDTTAIGISIFYLTEKLLNNLNNINQT